MRLDIDHRFRLSDRGSDRTELRAGLTTFLTMAYVAFVNPQILADAGMPFDAVFVATCLAAAFSTLVMGLYANYPVALAPGMGLNAFFSYVVVIELGYRWEVALGAVFVAGVLFVVLSLFAGAALDHRCDPVRVEDGYLGGHRTVPRHHRAQERRRHHREPRHAGDLGQPA